ncbi:hypothetical protein PAPPERLAPAPP_01830 [Brevundimonas phage vB_BpoS-Papperlapapp]|nr:hypothetical protein PAPPERLAPAPP_01830 [Brevundimonas phage vB_BpoS-Papperlapapp]
MILTDLAQHNQKRLKKHDVMSIARSVKKHLSRLTSMGYTAGAVSEGERGIVKVTTPQGRRFEIAVREISCDEEIMQAQAYCAALDDLDPKNLPPVSGPAPEGVIQTLAAEARGCPIKTWVSEPQPAVITGKATRVLERRSSLAGLNIDGEYVYRNYAVNYDGRTWDDLSPSERLSWDDQAALLVGRLARKKAPEPVAAVKTPEPVTGRDLYMTMIDNSGVHCNRFPAWNELDEAAQADWNRKAQN